MSELENETRRIAREEAERVIAEKLDSLTIPDAKEEQLITVQQLAEKLGKSETSLYRASQNRTLPSYKIAGTVYFKYSEVLAVSRRHNLKEVA